MHWHGYSYAGAYCVEAEAGADIAHVRVPEGYPPFDTADWLRRPKAEIAATFITPEDAMAWMREGLAAMPPADAAEVSDALLYGRWHLCQTPSEDVRAGYFTRYGSYVTRAVVACGDRAMLPPTAPVPRCPETQE